MQANIRQGPRIDPGLTTGLETGVDSLAHQLRALGMPTVTSDFRWS